MARLRHRRHAELEPQPAAQHRVRRRVRVFSQARGGHLAIKRGLSLS